MNATQTKRAIIVGATSGIGYETALLLLQEGWMLGIAGRREEKLKELQAQAPDRIRTMILDVCSPDAPYRLKELIDSLGGMNLYIHCSGIGHQNPELNQDIELQTLETNATGFTRMLIAAFHFFFF